MIELWVNVFLASLLVIITFYILRLKRLIGIVALSGAYSLTAAAIFVSANSTILDTSVPIACNTSRV